MDQPQVYSTPDSTIVFTGTRSPLTPFERLFAEECEVVTT